MAKRRLWTRSLLRSERQEQAKPSDSASYRKRSSGFVVHLFPVSFIVIPACLWGYRLAGEVILEHQHSTVFQLGLVDGSRCWALGRYIKQLYGSWYHHRCNVIRQNTRIRVAIQIDWDYLNIRKSCDIIPIRTKFGATQMLCFLALCPQWTYLSVFIGYIADEAGSEYLIWKHHVTRFIANL